MLSFRKGRRFPPSFAGLHFQLHLSGLELDFPSFPQMLWQQKKGKSEHFSMTFRHCSDNYKTSKIQSKSLSLGLCWELSILGSRLRVHNLGDAAQRWPIHSGGPKQDKNMP